MKKLLIIIIALLPVGLFGQQFLYMKSGGKIVKFQNSIIVIYDTTTPSTAVTTVGDGITIGDGITVGDDVITEATSIIMPKQFMKKEEEINNLLS